MFKESLRMSFSNITSNKMRTFLTVLGIIIGVMAIITLITVMESATGEVTNQFESLGTGKLIIQTPGTPLKRGLTDKDMKNIEALDGVSGISPTLSQIISVALKGAVLEDVTLNGYGYAFFKKNNDNIAKGRPLVPSDIDGNANVGVIDKDLAEALFSGVNPLGKKLIVSGISITVVGILKEPEVDDVMNMTQTADVNGKLIIPYTTYMKMFRLKNVNMLEVYLNDAGMGVKATKMLEPVLDRAFNYNDDSYSIINMESLLEVMDTMMGLMTNLLVGIASIALLVGGIGIMNMMLVSVTERTHEIGLRKALGARPRSIQVQFLLESIMLSLFGGMIGLVLGILVSLLLSSIMDIAFVLSAGAIMLGVGFSLAVGVIFGWAPARKASHLNPIDALRSM